MNSQINIHTKHTGSRLVGKAKINTSPVRTRNQSQTRILATFWKPNYAWHGQLPWILPKESGSCQHQSSSHLERELNRGQARLSADRKDHGHVEDAHCRLISECEESSREVQMSQYKRCYSALCHSLGFFMWEQTRNASNKSRNQSGFPTAEDKQFT